MLHNISVNKYFKFIIIFTIFFLLLVVFCKLHLNLATDDYFFSRITDKWSIIDLLIFRYKFWGGRLAIEAIMLSTINYSLFWRLAIPLSLLLMAASISRLVCQKFVLFYTFIALVLLFLIPINISYNAGWWVTGFYNYLMPMSLATYTLSFLFTPQQSKTEFFIASLTTFVFSYAEQTGMYFLFIAFIGLVVFKKARTYKGFCVYILAFINYLILVTAPGNYIRMIQETWSWFPEYSYYSFAQKLCFGFDKFHQILVLYWNIPLITICLLLLILYIAYGLKSFAGNISLMTTILFICISLLQWTGHNFNFLGNNFLNMNLLNADKWVSVSMYTSYFFVMMIIISLIILMVSTLKNNSILLMNLSIFLIGIFSTILVGFSPTVYVSNFRIDYVFEVCCVLNSLYLMHYLYQLSQKDSQQTI